MNLRSFPSPFARTASRKGFTLLEMMIALAIFILLSASVFGILTGVLETSSSLQDNQNRRDQIDRLNAYLRKKLKSLPAQSSIISYQRGTGEGLNQDGIIFGQQSNLTAVDAKIQNNGYYMLRVATFDPTTLPANSSTTPLQFFETNVINDSGIVWSLLVKDILHLNWRFQQLNATDWVLVWNDTTNTPNMVEFLVQPAADLQPSTMDFWIPPITAITTTTSGIGGPGGFGPGGGRGNGSGGQGNN